MGRGRGETTKLRSFRLPDEKWEFLKKNGGGNATKGLNDYIDQLMQVEIEGIGGVGDINIVETVHKELTITLDTSLHKYFIDAVDFWIRNGFKPARIERYCAVFGVDGGNTRRTGQIMKRLEGGGVMLQDYGGFRPKVQCNNGLSEDEFLEYFDRYSNIVKQRPENEDLLNNILVTNINIDR